MLSSVSMLMQTNHSIKSMQVHFQGIQNHLKSKKMYQILFSLKLETLLVQARVYESLTYPLQIYLVKLELHLS